MNLTDYALWTAVVTPLNKDLSIDFPSLKNLIAQQDAAKNGLLILGSTGEALNLDLEDKKQIVEYVISLNPNSPIMIGVGGHELNATKSWVNWLETKNIHAYLMVTPIYAKPGAHGQTHWFKTLMDEVSRPVMLYNVPGRSGTSLSIDAVNNLKTHKNYWGIKEASGSVEKFKEYLSASDGKNVYCGDDALFPDFALNGSCGLISVASNAWPAQTHKYVEQCLNKSFDAKELWEKASNSMFLASNPVPAKCLLAHQKRITNNTMMPPLHADDLNDLSPIIEADSKVNHWFSTQE